MCCLVAVFAWVAPRLTLFLMWVFGFDNLKWAIDSWILGFLGFLVLPYTTVLYVIAYAPTAGVSGLGWFFVALGFLMDLSSIFGGGKQGQTVYVERYR